MRTSLASITLLVSALAACSDGAPTSPASAVAASQRTVASQVSGTARPFEGSCTTTFNTPPFPLPPVLHQIDVGSCLLTHLGLTDFYGEQDINLAAGTQSGWRRLTAANGDELYFTHSGKSTPAGPGQVKFTATLTFVGGTGRFAGATGTAIGTGGANLITRSASVTIVGRISY